MSDLVYIYRGGELIRCPNCSSTAKRFGDEMSYRCIDCGRIFKFDHEKTEEHLLSEHRWGVFREEEV